MFSMPSMLLSPIVSWVFAVMWAAGWCASLVVIAATDTITEQENYVLGPLIFFLSDSHLILAHPTSPNVAQLHPTSPNFTLP
jgi:hypothetical protein